MAFPPDVIELFESGSSIVVGTRDAKLLPEVARAGGARVDRTADRITVFLAQSTASRTLANLAANGAIAVSFTHVFSHRAIQTKGKVVSVGPAAESDRDVVKHYMSAWAEILYLTGIPRAVTLQCASWPAVAITFDVTETFNQTPGPKAGDRHA